MTKNPPHDVAVVGFGPIGQLLALLLGRRGHDVLVLERWPEPYPLPRAVHFDHEIGRIFQAAGVGEQVRALTDPVPDHYEWRNRQGEALVRIDWSGTGPSGWPTANFFSQPELEAVLAAEAAAVPGVTLHRGQELVGLRDIPGGEGDGHVELTARAADGTTFTHAARWVIGADGANSFVRRHMDTEETDLGFFFDWLIVDTLPHDRETVWSPMNWQLCDPARPTTVVSGGPGRRRWEFMRLPGETVEELNTPEAAWRLLAPWGRTPENTTLERHTVYTFQACWADRWRDGRLLLAGDAAHRMPPFAGQGMCSGVRDALNLAWKLDLVLRGASEAALLDSYTSERREHVQHAIGMSMALGRVICVLDEEEARERDARMTAGGADPARVLPPAPPPVLGDGVLQRGADGARRADVGHLTPQYRVRAGERTGLIDAFTGGGFVLLTDGPGPLAALDAADRAFLAGVGTAFVPLHPKGTTPDGGLPDGEYEDVDDAWLPHLRGHGHVAALIRPDFYLFGTATDAADLRDLVAQLRARLHHRAPSPALPA
ncbi:bifunctional 3-(3-hydroxy-phenyl)propionate/3-hydroxycinnamic acid hydroxylase [Streptomyces sp. DSM 44917]|uniref:Bifunctional 3-(3-hydroxy-phenyl)propionate/3-hydroxycinnamic acid hydroxylase n=1 Tax=Streptomyces boetiae TaxID=3075541 RepID=A0ABU2L7D9_9ACTN|nr:bifunctional 3-(3-hydroxy-phenyl)propionate/3-hydroxycinnamic acid hydroxylase [Streptomyces sp. DSM 44917]MDT0307494.1 bifunctional 3-(3-hydroxy-phenyl)propionate/3-hydroxycinnamic acid hydroxylase [Streptomyces sp. DSM 44917]